VVTRQGAARDADDDVVMGDASSSAAAPSSSSSSSSSNMPKASVAAAPSSSSFVFSRSSATAPAGALATSSLVQPAPRSRSVIADARGHVLPSAFLHPTYNSIDRVSQGKFPTLDGFKLSKRSLLPKDRLLDIMDRSSKIATTRRNKSWVDERKTLLNEFLGPFDTDWQDIQQRPSLFLPALIDTRAQDLSLLPRTADNKKPSPNWSTFDEVFMACEFFGHFDVIENMNICKQFEDFHLYVPRQNWKIDKQPINNLQMPGRDEKLQVYHPLGTFITMLKKLPKPQDRSHVFTDFYNHLRQHDLYLSASMVLETGEADFVYYDNVSADEAAAMAAAAKKAAAEKEQAERLRFAGGAKSKEAKNIRGEEERLKEMMGEEEEKKKDEETAEEKKKRLEEERWSKMNDEQKRREYSRKVFESLRAGGFLSVPPNQNVLLGGDDDSTPLCSNCGRPMRETEDSFDCVGFCRNQSIRKIFNDADIFLKQKQEKNPDLLGTLEPELNEADQIEEPYKLAGHELKQACMLKNWDSAYTKIFQRKRDLVQHVFKPLRKMMAHFKNDGSLNIDPTFAINARALALRFLQYRLKWKTAIDGDEVKKESKYTQFKVPSDLELLKTLAASIKIMSERRNVSSVSSTNLTNAMIEYATQNHISLSSPEDLIKQRATAIRNWQGFDEETDSGNGVIVRSTSFFVFCMKMIHGAMMSFVCFSLFRRR
jgi:hypothetical protein